MSLSNSIVALSSQLGQTLKRKGWKVTCAESCTGGGIGFAITSVAGSSDWFEQGFITYSNEAKASILTVVEMDLEKYGAVSEPVALQMAEGAARLAESEMAISVTGIAGPGGGTEGKPVGTVWFGRYANGDLSATKQVFSGDRQEVREKAILFALQYCLDAL
ncbi:CinA family protein [Alteromonas sp. a30]|uniref:CinA family protein n=1 Tax=Alteromonas sp. a30 TaxID=2730917 RepID=UPI00227E99EE|nr:nicotinamide-nucleotide amidohydrolase family protein [Alteromonas sp. a30]MCY7295997.1 nicotinamide-nucleotide amidohydrolase family protein [Alteromonas sp. a30]